MRERFAIPLSFVCSSLELRTLAGIHFDDEVYISKDDHDTAIRTKENESML